jgi:hypothetical protein
MKPCTTVKGKLPDIKEKSVDELLNTHNKLFSKELGCYTGTPIHLDVTEMPWFHKSRPVPYAIQANVESALLEMESSGVLQRVISSECAAPIVSVAKRDGNRVRICGDFSVTYNKCATVYKYPIPRIEDLHAALRGCTVFSVLDMSQAYHQIPLAKECQSFFTINTHIVLFQFTRLPNGVHSGPAVFQQILDTVLAGVPQVICYLDNILVAGVDEEDHLRTRYVVFQKLLEAGFKLNKQIFKAKCYISSTCH